MKEMLITLDDNSQLKCYAVYYSSQGRYYIIYTDKSMDEKGYVIIHLAKVLKVVNRNEENVVIPTGAYVGMEVTDQLEWNTVKNDIQTVIANLQGDDSATVQYLPLDEIKGIVIKSSKTFRLSEEIVNLIIKEEEPVVETPVVAPVEEPAVAVPVEPAVVEPVVETPSVVAPVVAPAEQAVVAPVDVPSVPSVEDEMPMPAVAPNPFEFIPSAEVNEEVPEEPKPVNPYAELQKQRDEEMIKNLASDDMQDISPVTVLSVDELEKTQEVAPVVETPVAAPVEPTIVEPVVETPSVVTPVVETPAIVAPVNDEVKVETVSGQSFVDSIVADVSDILDDKSVVAPKSDEDGEDYKQLYHDELEKTIELEKELKELHSKLNNIKNIVE